MLSVVPSPMVSMLMAASLNLTRFGSSFLKTGSSFFLRKGDDSVLALARPLLPPSLSQLSQSSLRPQPPMRQSTDILAQPPWPPAGHEAQLPDRPWSSKIISPVFFFAGCSLLGALSGGVMATIAVIVCLFWVGIGEGIGFHFSGALVNVTHLPVALGLYGFCYSGHSVLPNIYSSMKERSQFPFVLLFCFTVVTVAYAGIVVSGFLMFGESTMSQFTLNLAQQYIPSKIAIWMTCIPRVCYKCSHLLRQNVHWYLTDQLLPRLSVSGCIWYSKFSLQSGTPSSVCNLQSGAPSSGCIWYSNSESINQLR